MELLGAFLIIAGAILGVVLVIFWIIFPWMVYSKLSRIETLLMELGKVSVHAVDVLERGKNN